MQSHRDQDTQNSYMKKVFLKELEARAKKIVEAGGSQITGGVERNH